MDKKELMSFIKDMSYPKHTNKDITMLANCKMYGFVSYNKEKGFVHCDLPECYWCRNFEKKLGNQLKTK